MYNLCIVHCIAYNVDCNCTMDGIIMYIVSRLFISIVVYLYLSPLNNTLYAIHCTMYNVQCTMYNVHCAMYNVHCTLYTLLCTVYAVHCTVFNLHVCTMYNVHCTLNIYMYPLFVILQYRNGPTVYYI